MVSDENIQKFYRRSLFYRAEQLYPEVKNLSSDKLLSIFDLILSKEHPQIPKPHAGLRFADSLISMFVKDGQYEKIMKMKYKDGLNMHPDRLKSLQSQATTVERFRKQEK